MATLQIGPEDRDTLIKLRAIGQSVALRNDLEDTTFVEFLVDICGALLDSLDKAEEKSEDEG